MAAAASFAIPVPAVARLRNLRVAEALAVEERPKPAPMTREQAYDLLAATSVGSEAATLVLKALFDAPERKVLGRFVTFATPRRRAIKGKGRTQEILLATKTGGVEVLGEGDTWEEAWAATCRRIGAAT